MDNTELAIKIVDALREHGKVKGVGLAKASIVKKVLDENIEVIKAEQNLTGFSHAAQGYDITSLIEAMNLRPEEWDEMKREDYVSWLPKKLKDEIEEYFDR